MREPAVWPTARLDEIADIGTGVTLGRELGASSSSEHPYLRVANVQDGYIDTSDVKSIRILPSEYSRYALKKGDILLTEGGDFDKLGRGAVWDGTIPNCLHQNHIFRVRLHGGHFPAFFSAYMGSLQGRSYFLSCAKQTTNLASINKTQLSAMPVPVPPPHEQQQIANILDSVNTRITHAESLIQKTQLLEEGITKNLFEMPHGNESTLSDLCSPERGSMTIGPFGSNLTATDYQDSGIPVVFVQDLREGIYKNVSNVHVNTAKARQLAAHSARSGDLLLTKMGLPPCVAAVYPPGSPDAVITADIIRIRPDIRIVNPEWLACAINHERLRSQVRGITGGVTRPKVTLRDVRNLKLAVPPLIEQQEAMAAINAARKRRVSAQQSLSKLQILKQGLMDDLLTGRVRVPVG